MSATRNRKSGEVVAALISAWLGMAAVAGSHLWSVAEPNRANLFLLKMGTWIPGFQKVGPYIGKETMGLIVWLVTWVVLFLLLRNRVLSLRAWAYAFVAGIIIVTVILWPPLIHAIIGWNPTTV